MSTSSSENPSKSPQTPTQPEVSGIAAGAMAGAIQATGRQPNSAAEEAYWREQFPSLPWVQPEATFEDYAAAFALGWQGPVGCCPGAESAFTLAEAILRNRWEQQPAAEQLDWNLARPAVRAAWERVQDTLSSGGDAKAGAR